MNHLYKDLFICSSCRSIQKRPQPGKLLWQLRNRGSALGACFDESVALTRMEEAEKQLITLQKFTNPGTLFDVGCNAGFFNKVAKDKGWKVTGNDISIKAVNLGRERFGLNIIFGYFDDINLDNDSYDAINLWNVLEHTHNPVEILKKCCDLLKLHGILMVKLPHKIPDNIMDFHDTFHLFEWDKDVSDYMIQNLGFKRIWSRIDSRAQDELTHIESFYRKV